MRIYMIHKANYNLQLVRGLGFSYSTLLSSIQCFDIRGTIFSKDKAIELKRRL